MNDPMKYLVSFLLLFAFSLPLAAQHWSYDHLSGPKSSMNVASCGSKVFFYSGTTKIGSSIVLVEDVEIIDVQTGIKESTPLPTGVARTDCGVAVLGSKIFFAGGRGSLGQSTRVDIYDTLTGIWSTANLSAKRDNIAATAASAKVFFGGGYGDGTYSSVVDIYNQTTNTWTATQFPNGTVAPIPPQRTDLTALAVGNKILFAGGLSVGYRKLVSVYDAGSNSWLSNRSLSQHKGSLNSIVYKNKGYFIGGLGRSNSSDVGLVFPSDTIDLYDSNTDTWSTLKIPHIMHDTYNAKRAYTQVALAGCKLFLVPSLSSRGTTDPNPLYDSFPDTIAIYDLERNTWNFEALPHSRTAVTVVAAQNKVYFAGGASTYHPVIRFDDIDIYTLLPKLQLKVSVSPITDYSHDFGNVLTTDAVNTQLDISNEGDYFLRFKDGSDKISLTGDLSDFTIDLSALQAEDTLEPAQLLHIPVSFHPQSAGEKTVTLQIASNDPDLPLYSFVLKGNGTLTNSTQNAHETQAVTIYPVPCSDVLNIQLHAPFQQASFRLTDLNGKVIVDLKDMKATHALSTASIPNGIYLLQILADTTTYSSKVVIAHES